VHTAWPCKPHGKHDSNYVSS